MQRDPNINKSSRLWSSLVTYVRNFRLNAMKVYAALQQYINKSSRLWSLLVTYVRNFRLRAMKAYAALQQWLDARAEQSTWTNLDWFVLVVAACLWIPYILWIQYWLSNTSMESARWALAAEAGAAAVIFALLIAAMSFRWRVVQDEEKDARHEIDTTLVKLGSPIDGITSSSGVIDVAYDQYFSSILERKNNGQLISEPEFMALGRLWSIRKLCHAHLLGAKFKYSRILKKCDVNDLLRVSMQSRNAAINMWDKYHGKPSEFLLEMYDTLSSLPYSSSPKALTNLPKSGTILSDKTSSCTYAVIESVRQEVGRSPKWFNAQRIKFVGSRFVPAFYGTSLILCVAIALGLLALAAIGNQLPVNLGENTIGEFVAVPVGVLLLGITFTFYTVITVIV